MLAPWLALALAAAVTLSPVHGVHPALADDEGSAGAPVVVGGTLLVLNKSDATASFIHPDTGHTWLQLPTGDGPHEVAVSPNGQLAVVADYGGQLGAGNTLTVLDLTTATVKATVDLESNERPHGIQFVGGNDLVAVTIETRARLLLVDIQSGRVRKSIPTQAQASHMVVVSPDGHRAYTANIASGDVSVLDLQSGQFEKLVATGAGCEGIDISPDGSEVWTANRAANTVSVINTESLEVVAQLTCAEFPIRLKFTPDGKRAVVSNAVSSEVVVFDTASRKELGRIAIDFDIVDGAGQRLFGEDFAGSATPIGVLITQSGRHAFVAAANADVVTLVDLETLGVLRGYETGKQPDGLGWTPLTRPVTATPGATDNSTEPEPEGGR